MQGIILSIVPISFFFLPHRMACRILVPQPGIKPTPPALEAWSLNHWMAREVPVVPISFEVKGLSEIYIQCLAHIWLLFSLFHI